MALVHPVCDLERGTFTINSPIKTIYLRTNQQLTPNSNYYVSLYLNQSLISLTNQFKKVVIDGIELYQLDLFANQLVLLINRSIYNNQISLIGGIWDPNQKGAILSTTIQFTDIYYETDENYKPDLKEPFEQEIKYINCELTNLLRAKWSGACRKVYGQDVDNVIRYADGCAIVVYQH